MFIKLTELWVRPVTIEGEPQFESHTFDVWVNTDKVYTFNVVDFHDSHEYNDIKDKNTGETIEIPRSVVVDGIEYTKVTKIYAPVQGRGHSVADYIHLLETPEQIMEKISGAVIAKPEEPPKKKRGRPPGSKNKPKDKNVNEGDKK